MIDLISNERQPDTLRKILFWPKKITKIEINENGKKRYKKDFPIFFFLLKANSEKS